jgi:hypothetical protein
MAQRGDGIYQRGKTCIMLASLCALLGVAASASAECAWVLWSQSVGPAGWLHIAIDGWKDREGCDKERSRRIQQSKDPAAPQMILSCLPDTVDPRGPKGTK